MADGYLDAPFVINHASPAGLYSIPLIGSARVEILHAWDLESFVEVVEDMKDGICIVEFHNRPVGKNASQTGREVFPLGCAMEIVYHQETAAIEIIAQPLGLRLIKLPVADF